MSFRDGAAHNLLLDADDTLWNNNIHFLDAFEAFASAVASVGLSAERKQLRSLVQTQELDVIKTHGYGKGPYVIALRRAAAEIAPDGYRRPLLEHVERIGRTFLARDCELLPGVEETVRELASRNRLILFTKGQRGEQMHKLNRSGLAPYFDRVETPREKDVAAYRRVVSEANLDPARTFMAGNSPRSDINPALRAGLRAAIFIPHPDTWELEREEIDRADPRIIELAGFRGLAELF